MPNCWYAFFHGLTEVCRAGRQEGHKPEALLASAQRRRKKEEGITVGGG